MSRTRLSPNLLLAVAIAVAAGPALADTVTLLPVKDNTLYEPITQDSFLDKSDGAGPTMFTGRVKDADADPGPATRAALRRAVLAFDIAGSIPAGATIDGVQLTLYCDKVKLNSGFNVTLHRLTSDWGEGASNTGNSQQGRGEPALVNDATWRHTFYPNAFSSRGALPEGPGDPRRPGGRPLHLLAAREPRQGAQGRERAVELLRRTTCR